MDEHGVRLVKVLRDFCSPYNSNLVFQERNMKNVNVSVDSKAPTAETASLLIALLDQLINDCQYVA